MKNLIILFITVSLCAGIVCAQEQKAETKEQKSQKKSTKKGKSPSQEQPTKLELPGKVFEDEADYYRIPIEYLKVKTPEKGIETGLVIVYGHPLKPPYKVEQVEDKVFINGVQVLPKLENPNYKAPDPRIKITDEWRKCEARILKIKGEIECYAEAMHAKYGKKEGIIKTKEYLRTLKSVKVKEELEDAVNLTFIECDKPVTELIDVTPIIPYNPGPIINHVSPQEYAQKQKEGWERDLKAGKGFIIDFKSEQSGWDNTAKSLVNSIMNDSKLSSQKKSEKLLDLLRDESVTKTIFYSYKGEEWGN
jgi:hypothetical protein